MARRLLMTMSFMVVLMGMYLGYRTVLGPMLTPRHANPILSIAPGNTDEAGGSTGRDNERVSAENVRVAKKYLADHPWTHDSQYQIRTDQAYLYANTCEPVGDQGEVRFRPFAIAYVDEAREGTPGETPRAPRVVTMICESALVKFASQFDLRMPNPGRMVGGALEGEVHVTGPDGLDIVGRNFYLSESASRMWSDHPVSFAFGPHRGNAGQLQAELIPAEYAVHADRPAIVGIRSVRLRRNVVVDVALKSKDNPLPLRVKTGGSFEYQVEDQTAIFEADRASKDFVVAFRETAPGKTDWLRCDQLTLGLVRKPGKPVKRSRVVDNGVAYQQINTDLKFGWMKAEGPQVTVISEERGLQADMTSLIYHADDQRLVASSAKQVVITQGGTVLRSPAITIDLGEENTVRAAMCEGPGRIESRTPNGEALAFAAGWKKSLQKLADPEAGLDVIELLEEASIRQPSRQTALGAQRIRFWVTPIATGLQTANRKPPRAGDPKTGERQADESKAVEPKTGEPKTGEPKTGELEAIAVQPRRMMAENEVALLSPQLEAEARTLTVDFEGEFRSRSGKKNAAEGESGERGDSPLGSSKPSGNKPPVRIQAEGVRVRMVPDEAGEAPTVADLWTEGAFVLGQTRDAAQPPLDVRGHKLHLQNSGETRQIVHVYGAGKGEPARICDSGMTFEGGAIHLDRFENLAWVDGPGRLQFPIKSGFNGEPLERPEVLDVAWQERMVFDGMKAGFDGDVIASFAGTVGQAMHQNRMSCQQMEVELTQRVSFSEPADEKAPRPELAGILCRDGVSFESYERLAGKLRQIRRGNIWQFRVQQISGRVEGVGRGNIQIWTRDDKPKEGESDVQLVKGEIAQANRPLRSDLAAWNYTRVDFDGGFDGNVHQRTTTFRERVQVVHGPVSRPTDTFHADQLPKGGGSLRCDTLQLTQQKSNDAKVKDWLELVASGNAILEGDGFHGRADQISFDQSKPLYVLKSQGKRPATFYRENVDRLNRPAEAGYRRIEFNPQDKSLNATVLFGGAG